MITSIEIENLRGIRTGKLEGLAPLTVLTGPNASGKSTFLDALLIAASPDPADAVGRAVKRHPAASGGARWLFRKEEWEAEVEVTTNTGRRSRRLKWFDHCHDNFADALAYRRSAPPYSMVSVQEDPNTDELSADWTAFGGDNQYVTKLSGGGDATAMSFIRLVDPGLPQPLHRTFSEVTKTGRREAVHELLADLVPGFERLEIIASAEDDFDLAVTANGISVPLGLSGDGIQAFTQLALEIAVAPKGLVLVEEPEVYQHPRAIRQSARALVANMRRGVQTVLTTHSLELIDALLAEIGDGIDDMALFNLALEDGELRAGRRAGKDIEFARETLENDLR